MTMSLQEIDDYIDGLQTNAAQLIREAKALHEIEAYARAYALAHFAREELSKAGMLTATGARILAGHPVDWKVLASRMRDHKAKLRLETVEMAFLMKGAGQHEQADRLLSGAATGAAEVRNSYKNDSLYVGFSEGKVTLPCDTRTEHQSMRTIELAEMSLKESEFRGRARGPFAGREIGSLKMPRYDQIGIAKDAIAFAAEMTVLLSMLAEASEEPPADRPAEDHSAP